MHGYHGRYLRIDLTAGRATWVALDEAVLRETIGGVGLGTWILTNESPAGVDPLDPASAVVFCFSPLVGTALTTSAKFAVVAKSPLTQRLNDALSSSHFAIAGKRTGADAIVLVGRCAALSVVSVFDDGVRAEACPDLAGLSSPAATSRIRELFGEDRPAAVIGPAGENLVMYATVSHGNRHAGRGGLGANLGSKNVKALVVGGSRRTTLADAGRVNRLAKDLSRRSFGPATAKYRELGTVANLPAFNRLHALPTRNFQAGHFEEAESLASFAVGEARKLARESCAACTIGCEHVFATSDGKGVRLEYETLFAFGPLCGIGDRDVVLRAAAQCDELGLDTISAGGTIAFAMECAERGWLNMPCPRFGDGEGLLALLPRIARRDSDLGELLAHGSRIAAVRIGGDAPSIAPHVKGLELPGYEPRALQTMALGLAVGSRGADHNRSGAYEADFGADADRFCGDERSARLAVDTENAAALIDSLILCKFLRKVFADIYDESAELLSAVTGWDVTGDKLRRSAKGVIDAKKRFNVREGWTRAEDSLPARMLTDSLDAGGREAALPPERLARMIAAYYRERGWDAEGRPQG